MQGETAENGIFYIYMHCHDFSSASFVMHMSYTVIFMSSLFQAEQSFSEHYCDYTQNTTCLRYTINH